MMAHSRHTTVCVRYYLSQGRPCACDLTKQAVVIYDQDLEPPDDDQEDDTP